MLAVNEVFQSMQGEGPAVGQIATFVRFYGCNDYCDFCDSTYAVKGDEFTCMSSSALINLIINNSTDLVILTGGEPTIQNEQSMYELVLGLTNAGKVIDIETNGSNLHLFWLKYVRHIVVSPKKRPVDFNTSFHLYFKLLWQDGYIKYLSSKIINYLSDNNYSYYLSVVAPVPFDQVVYILRVTNLIGYLQLNRFILGHIIDDEVGSVKVLPSKKAIINLQAHKLLWQDERRK